MRIGGALPIRWSPHLPGQALTDSDPSIAEDELVEHILNAQQGDEGAFSVLYTRPSRTPRPLPGSSRFARRVAPLGCHRQPMSCVDYHRDVCWCATAMRSITP